MKKQKTKKISKETIKQSEKMSDLIAQIGKTNIDISNFRATIAGLTIKIQNLEELNKELRQKFEASDEFHRQFKQNLVKFIMEH